MIMQSKTTSRSGGLALVDTLLQHGVDTAFCLPGESYLPVLDALYECRDRINLYSTRHDSGAAFMAEAYGKLTGQPGICFVTRGPGAANASIAVHVARQDSTPMILFVGQVPTGQLGREAFQEVDFTRMFAPLAKHVEQLGAADDVADTVARAFSMATSGRPGPVVVALPEDLLGSNTECSAGPIARTPATISDHEFDALRSLLEAAQRPMILVGGSQWTAQAREQIVDFAGTNEIPVCCSFRHHDVFDNADEHYVGYLGLNAHLPLWQRLADSDCLLVLGARLDAPTTRGYNALDAAQTATSLIHVHPDADALGRNFPPRLALRVDVPAVVERLHTLTRLPVERWRQWTREGRSEYLASTKPPPSVHALDMGQLMIDLNTLLPDDAIVTLDAGNFTAWPQRFRQYRRPGRLLAPVNGAMGYGVPAAVAAALTCPQQTVVGFIGDGGMLMTGMELATAMQYQAKPILLVVNNSMYGTIRLHQERAFPGRPIATDLTNPDFAELARSFGAFGAVVTRNDEFKTAYTAALASNTAAILDLRVDPDVLIPGLTLSQLQQRAS